MFILDSCSSFNVNLVECQRSPHFAVSDLVLRCLPMSHKKDARRIWVNVVLVWHLLENLLFLYNTLFLLSFVHPSFLPRIIQSSLFLPVILCNVGFNTSRSCQFLMSCSV